jgi:hypothetical protein
MEERMKQMEEAMELSPGPSWSQPGSPPPQGSPPPSISGSRSANKDGEIGKSPAMSEYDGAKYRLTVDEAGNVSRINSVLLKPR